MPTVPPSSLARSWIPTRFTWASRGNWTVEQTANLSVSTLTPLTLELIRADGSTRSATTAGERRRTSTLTRVFDAPVGPVLTNTLAYDVLLDGTALSVNPALPSEGHTRWTVVADGRTVTWNRNARSRGTWNFLPLGGFTPGSGHDRVFITIDGLTAGPFTPAELATRHGSSASAQY